MSPEQVEALLADLQATRTQADVLRWQTRLYLSVLRESQQRLARQMQQARRGFERVRDGDGDERPG